MSQPVRARLERVLSLCLRQGLADRLLFGSDFPLVDPATYAQRLRRIRTGSLIRWLLRAPNVSAETREAILGKNAAKLLKLDVAGSQSPT